MFVCDICVPTVLVKLIVVCSVNFMYRCSMYIVVFFYISVPSFSYIICLNFANTFSVNNKNALRLALKYIY